MTDIDLDALTALIDDADLTLPIQMEYRFSAELMCDVGNMIVGNGVEARIHTVQTARLIEAALNNLPALLSALTATRAELDKAVRQRDSLARRCAVRFGETETARAEADQLRAELAEQRSRNLTYLANQGALNQRLTADLEQAKAQRADYARALLVMRGAYHATHDVTSDSEQFVANVEACDWPVCVGGRMAQAAPAAAPKPDEDLRCGDSGPDGAKCVRTVGHEHAGRSHRGVDSDGEERTWHRKAAGAGDGEQDTATTAIVRADIHDQILAFPCPSCGVPAGMVCVDRKRTHSHIKRRTLAASVQGAADGEAQA